jgi:hypothetical protein
MAPRGAGAPGSSAPARRNGTSSDRTIPSPRTALCPGEPSGAGGRLPRRMESGSSARASQSRSLSAFAPLESPVWTSKRPRMRRGDEISNSVGRECGTRTTSSSSAMVTGRSRVDAIRRSDGPGGAASLMRSLTCRGPDGPIAQPPFRGWLVLARPRRGRDRPLAATRLNVRRGPAHACSMGPGRRRPSGVLGCHRMVGHNRARARRAALRIRPGRTSATAPTTQAAPLRRPAAKRTRASSILSARSAENELRFCLGLR